jgi:hypothetical protein
LERKYDNRYRVGVDGAAFSMMNPFVKLHGLVIDEPVRINLGVAFVHVNVNVFVHAFSS